MKNPHSEMIWKGRLHLGDEPGVYGDASYSGLGCQLPATLTKFAPAGSADDITFQVGTTDVQIFDPYPGHKVTIVAFVPIPNMTPQQFESVVVGETRITTSGVLSVGTTNTIDKRYFSVRVEVDTEVPPGLYDDFVFVSLSLKSTTHFADFEQSNGFLVVGIVISPVVKTPLASPHPNSIDHSSAQGHRQGFE